MKQSGLEADSSAERSLTQSDRPWRQGDLVEVTITDLSDSGDGVGRFGQRVVFVPDTVTGDLALVRLVRVKSHYAHGKLHQLLQPSPHRIRPRCIVADKCGGCQWQHVSDAYQLEAKRNLVIQSLERIGGFVQPPVDTLLPVSEPLGYRNKATYPIGKSQQGQIQAGYYQKGSHQIVNLNQCPIQDARLNPLLAEIKQDIQQQGWAIYDEQSHQGLVRHLGLRIGRRTGEQLLTLVVTDWKLPGVEQQAQAWMQRYPDLVGVVLNRNPQRGNAIWGAETRCLAGRPYLQEIFAGLTFQIQPQTFFQVNTEQAEALLQVIQSELDLQGSEILLDAYCGIGTLSLPLAQRVRQAIGLEVQPEAVEQATQNAQLNQIDNASFQSGTVEQLLSQLTVQPDIVILDPPRKGCVGTYHANGVIEALLHLRPRQIVYVSCNPATLARDLKRLCGPDRYHLQRIQPADFFPQTAHVESAAFLTQNT